MIWTTEQLDQFVERSDELGGPTAQPCQEFWSDFSYRPNYKVNQALDPFSEAYVQEQTRLYDEIAGHAYDVRRDEQTSFDLPAHIGAPTPYNHPDPANLAMHLQRLSRALRCAGARKGEHLLDMGCGWGLSSELAAYIGLTVTAVDINPLFIRLVNERAVQGNRSISGVVSSFEDYRVDPPVDIVLFYECLHHAVRPWHVLAQLTRALGDQGRIILAGEPINDFWWKHWGLRLDAVSIYCIRKFGWFESGFSLKFISLALHRSGLRPVAHSDADSVIGVTVIGQLSPVQELLGHDCIDLFDAHGCFQDGTAAIFVGNSGLTLLFPVGSTSLTLYFSNFIGRPLSTAIEQDGHLLLEGDLGAGPIEIHVKRERDSTDLKFQVESWIPDDELKNGDRRTIGIHLQKIIFNKIFDEVYFGINSINLNFFYV